MLRGRLLVLADRLFLAPDKTSPLKAGLLELFCLLDNEIRRFEDSSRCTLINGEKSSPLKEEGEFLLTERSMQMNVEVAIFMKIIQPLFFWKFMIENESQDEAVGHSVFQISLTPSRKCVFPPTSLINFPFVYRCGERWATRSDRYFFGSVAWRD